MKIGDLVKLNWDYESPYFPSDSAGLVVDKTAWQATVIFSDYGAKQYKTTLPVDAFVIVSEKNS